MSILDINVNLWSDFVVIFWISEYLQQCIHVWNKINGQIIAKIAKQFKIEPFFWEIVILNLLRELELLWCAKLHK
jgi:hypothetical protein